MELDVAFHSQLEDCCSWNHGFLRHNSMLCQCSAFGQVNLKVRFVLSSRNLSEYCGEPEDTRQDNQTFKVFLVSWTIFTCQAPNQTLLERTHSGGVMNKLRWCRFEDLKWLKGHFFCLLNVCLWLWLWKCFLQVYRKYCELAKQQREATTPAYSNDACPTQSSQTRLIVVLGAAHQAPQHNKKSGNICVCVCVFLDLWTCLWDCQLYLRDV